MEEYDKLINSSIILEESELIKELYNNSVFRREDKVIKKKCVWILFWIRRKKYIELSKLKLEDQEKYEKFLRYGENVDTVELINNFFGGDLKGKKRKQMINIRRNIGVFWRSLKKEEKEKYINLVNEYYK